MNSSAGLFAELLSVVVRTTLVVVLAELIARALAKRSAAIRHAVWAGALVAVIILPASAVLRFPALISVPTYQPLPKYTDANRSFGNQRDEPRPSSGTTSTVSSTGNRANLWDNTNRLVTADVLGRVMLRLWAVGVLIAVVRVLRAHRNAAALARRAHPHRNQSVRRCWDVVCGRRGLHGIELRESHDVNTPATIGIWQPCVILPTVARDWELERIEAVFEHELAHVRRRDGLVHLLAQCAAAVHWYHPLVARATRMLAAERERSCDDAVLTSGTSPLRYAELLLWAAQNAPFTRASAALALTGRTELEVRLRAILDPRRPRAELSAHCVAFGFVIAATVALVMSAVQLDAARPAERSANVASPRVIPSDQSSRGDARPAADDVVLQVRDPVKRLPAPEPDLLADSVAAPHTELVNMSAWGEPSRRLAEAHAAALKLLHGPDSVVVLRLMQGLQRVPRTDDDLVRERSAWALLSARDGSVVNSATDALHSSNWRVRAYGAWTLGVAGPHATRDERALPRLIAALEDPIWRVRAAAAFALQDIGDASAFPALRRALDDAAWQVRVPAVEFVARMGGPAERKVIEKLLNDRHVAVRSAAAHALTIQ